MDDSKKFATPQDEIKHWRELAQKLKQDLEETKEEFEEFQISSKELEAELESQLEQLESKNKELESENYKLRDQNEIYKEKLENLQSHSHKQLTELEDELAQVRAFKDELQKYIRELEQTNDDLERTKKATVVSLEDFESRLNEAIERNAFLESELDQKETLSETVQRLKDEARDLRSELSVVKKKTVTKDDSIDNQNSNATLKTKEETPVDSNKLTDSGYASCRTPPNRGIPTLNGGGGTPMTPSARISALNIVGDLLRKVGALESKLSTCRNFVKDPSRSGKAAGSTSPSSSPRAKRLNRGASVPPQQGVKIPV